MCPILDGYGITGMF